MTKQHLTLALTTALFVGLFVVQAETTSAEPNAAWTPPSYPLVACDPYFSIWSEGKTIVDCNTTHWTGKPHRLTILARVDGKTYRVLGTTSQELPALSQASHKILPTRSIFQMTGAGVELDLTFTTPALPADIDMLSRPITYVSFDVRSADGQPHEVQLLFTASGEIAVDTPNQDISTAAIPQTGNTLLRAGSEHQAILGREGDDLRIDWGYLYLAARNSMVQQAEAGSGLEVHRHFQEGKPLTTTGEPGDPTPGGESTLSLALTPVTVGDKPVQQWLLLAYDDLYSIEFMEKPLRPYWRRNGLDGEGLVRESLRDYESIVAKCEAFDLELTVDLQTVGGPEYVDIACLAYRQCFAAGKFVADANGQPLQFSKENHSNGCIATSDVFYPMAPQFLLFGPSLAKSFVVPFMEYAESDRWKFAFAPHDLGTYPKANGQVYGGGETSEENQMPVEECGNMLILMGAIAKLDGNADFATKYWPTLLQWAKYLKDTGFDPDSQLCTDDFAGHLAHNVNLSAKAICALGAFAQLCDMRGEAELAKEYRKIAKDFAARWMKEAKDGDHYRLAFDKPGTWSQKYNLVWDRLLGLDLFPQSVLRTEMDYYKKIQNRYGLPLDNRREYTKLDWILWTATLTQDRNDFQALVRPVHRFLNETQDRSPMTDWYETKSGRKVGFTARPVVGGVYLQMLHHGQIWRKWGKRDRTNANGYADLPTPPKVEVIVAAADSAPAEWKFLNKQPQEGWQQPNFDDTTWNVGQSGFGTKGTPGAQVGTEWNSSDIWIRRSFNLPQPTGGTLKLYMHHDDDVEVYINGVLAQRIRGYTTRYVRFPIRDEVLETLKQSGNVIAIHCKQFHGGQYLDAGLVLIESE